MSAWLSSLLGNKKNEAPNPPPPKKKKSHKVRFSSNTSQRPVVAATDRASVAGYGSERDNKHVFNAHIQV